MMNRLRTALVSVTAVAVAMMVLGSNARAGSVSTASPQNYLSFLERLARGEITNGNSLMKGYSSLERTMNILENTRHPGPRLVRQIATLYNQELMVFSNIQKNLNALLATQTDLQGQYQALQSQKEALLAAGRVKQARSVAMQQGQVFNVLNSVQRLVVAERGVATPVQ